MPTASFARRKDELETYFDRTASEAWARLTSDAPVSRIRATVRAGRDAMRATLLSWLPEDLSGRRILDAGCGSGAFCIAAARRGAECLGVDVAASLTALAETRARESLAGAAAPAPRFQTGDMLDPGLGRFDHAVAMDSLIHYRAEDAVRALEGLAARTGRSILFTFAPRTPLLATMHAAGALFPRGDRAPAIEPAREARLRALLAARLGAQGWRLGRTRRIARGFYISQALELTRETPDGR